MAICIDTRKAHLSRVFGEVTAVFSWAKLPDDAYADLSDIEEERVMYLLATYRAGTPTTPGSPPFVIKEKKAHLYVNSNGEPLAQLTITAKKAAEVLGLGTGKAWVKIASIILEGIPDLTRMPSSRPNEFLDGSFGSMTMREDGKVLAQQDIRFKDEGQEYV
jgi:hypothetical protein